MRVRQFLCDLEEKRHCVIATRNQRLAAIHGLARFIGMHAPELVQWCGEICNVPFKKAPHALVTYLEKPEMDAVLKASDVATAQGRRDHALVLFLYNAGARADEAAQVRIEDLRLPHVPGRDLAAVVIRGKGNKLRQCPLWTQTVQELMPLVQGREPGEHVFLNRCGLPITRFGIHTLIERAVARAVKKVPSLAAIHIKRLLQVLGQSTPLAEIPPKLQDYVNARANDQGRRGHKVSHVTIKKELATLSSIWNRWGVRKELVDSPLSLKNLEYPKRRELPPFQTWQQIQRRIARGELSEEIQQQLWDALFLTVPEIEELLEYVKKPALPWKSDGFPWVYPMFAFACHTGARRSEIIRSRVEDVDFEAGEVSIREKKKNHLKAETIRRVPMTPALRTALEQWFAVHPGGPITFCKTTGEELTPQMMHHYLRWTLDESKWKVIRGWHTFRHSFISNLASKGISERIMMELAGHLNPDTTRRYAHLIPSTMSDAVRSVFGNE